MYQRAAQHASVRAIEGHAQVGPVCRRQQINSRISSALRKEDCCSWDCCQVEVQIHFMTGSALPYS